MKKSYLLILFPIITSVLSGCVPLLDEIAPQRNQVILIPDASSSKHDYERRQNAYEREQNEYEREQNEYDRYDNELEREQNEYDRQQNEYDRKYNMY
jgi:hypothetical protein